MVSSSRRSGTKQTSSGCTRNANATMSSVTAISRLSLVRSIARRPLDVGVLDVTAVLPQVDGDAIGATLERQASGLERVGIVHPARLAQRGDVVDVHPEAGPRVGAGTPAHPSR